MNASLISAQLTPCISSISFPLPSFLPPLCTAQSIRTFADLERVGLDGVGRLLYVPDGVREALRDAIIYHIGTQGHDDGKFVAAQRYVPPPPVCTRLLLLPSSPPLLRLIHSLACPFA